MPALLGPAFPFINILLTGDQACLNMQHASVTIILVQVYFNCFLYKAAHIS